MKTVFLSYSSNDKERVAELVAAIQTHGWSVWWDHELEGGVKFESEIKQRISEATALLVIWSRNSVQSAWVKDEAQLAGDKVVPVLIDNVAPPMGMRDRHIVNLTEWDGSRGAPALTAVLSALDAIGDETVVAKSEKAKAALVFGARTSFALYAAALTASSFAGLRLAESTIDCEARPPEATGSLLYSCGETLSNQLVINVGIVVAALAFVLRAVMATWNTAADLGFDQLYTRHARARHLGVHAVIFILIFLTCFTAISIDMVIYDEGYGAGYRSVSAAYFDRDFMQKELTVSARAEASLREFAIDFGLLAVFGVISLYAYLRIRQRSVWGEVLLASASLMAFGFAFFLLHYGRPALLTDGFVQMRRAYSFGLGVLFAGTGVFALLSLLISRLGVRRG